MKAVTLHTTTADNAAQPATGIAKHTPGPWVLLEDQGFIHAPSTDQVVCQMWNKFEDDFHNSNLNARLIAASPELLFACQDLILMLQMSGSPLVQSKTVKGAQAAIEKATLA